MEARHPMHPIKVRILDNEYLIKTEEDEEWVLRIAEYVGAKLKEVQENTEGLTGKKEAILAALDIASDYFQLLRERDQMDAALRERTETLISTIDSVMG
jgi:cell division protein ZapA